MLVMVLSISVLSGINFKYELPNTRNELILLVDGSFSGSETEEAKNNFVQAVLNECEPEMRVGIVTFGFNQVYAAPLTTDKSRAYRQYLEAEKPDGSATDIASALQYAGGIFENPQSGKIVLLTDGDETDRSASAVIRTIAASGITVDTVHFPAERNDSEVLITGVTLPDYNVVVEDSFKIGLTLQSSFVGAANVTLLDNGEPVGEPHAIELVSGTQTVEFEHVFHEQGLHALSFEISNDRDTLTQNNIFNSYIYLEVFDDLLIIERNADESAALAEILGEQFNVSVVNVFNEEEMPTELDELRQYDEIILMNIANADMPAGFDSILYSYVNEIGGGLFTVGGNREDGEGGTIANTYDRQDMAGTLLQRMLPVEAIDYTPPLGMMIVIDVSGSMSSGTDVGTVQKIDAAKNAAVSMVRDYTCLNERDYCGVMTLSDDYTEDASLLPMTRQDEIIEAIYGVEKGGGTLFTPAVNHAGMALRALYTSGRIEKMHVVMITDGGAADYEDYVSRVEHFNSLGVTYSFIAIKATSASMEQLNEAAKVGGGKAYNADATDLTGVLKDDIRIPEIKEVEFREFVPNINPDSYYATVISQEEMPALYGFYGTKKKDDAELVLSGEYNVPVYAQWKYGNGTVGSFMCDLDGTWSADFLSAEGKGSEFLLSVINKLFPTEDIRPKNLDVVLREENYTTQISIYPKIELKEGESVEVLLENMTSSDASAQLTAPLAEEKYSRATLFAAEAGVYRITVQKKGADNAPSGNPCVVYKTFSYSEEFNLLASDTDGAEVMEAIAVSGNGKYELLSEKDAVTVFQGFKETLEKSFDPRFLFIITALCLFLLDIAARKFKWKWPHELIRERREKLRDANDSSNRNEARKK